MGANGRKEYNKKSDRTLDKFIPQHRLDELYDLCDRVEARAADLEAGWNEENVSRYIAVSDLFWKKVNELTTAYDHVITCKGIKAVNKKQNKYVYYYKILDRDKKNYDNRTLIGK